MRSANQGIMLIPVVSGKEAIHLNETIRSLAQKEGIDENMLYRAIKKGTSVRIKGGLYYVDYEL